MKNACLVLLAASTIISCTNSTTSQPTENASADSTISETQSTSAPVVGGDRDEHGCIGSAGYTWSPVKNECIRVFEQIKLTPTGAHEADSTAVAFLLFNKEQTKAEVYLPGQKQPIVLDRKGENWQKDTLELLTNHGYKLKNKDKIVFQGGK